MTTQAEARRRVKEIAREWDSFSEVLTTPIVYHPGGGEDTVPDSLKKKVWEQRQEKQVNGGWDEATDAEVLCYLMTASLVLPLNRDWTQLFLYEAALFMPQLRDSLPDTPKELSDDQQMQLGELKRKIRASQLKRVAAGVFAGSSKTSMFTASPLQIVATCPATRTGMGFTVMLRTLLSAVHGVPPRVLVVIRL